MSREVMLKQPSETKAQTISFDDALVDGDTIVQDRIAVIATDPDGAVVTTTIVESATVTSDGRKVTVITKNGTDRMRYHIDVFTGLTNLQLESLSYDFDLIVEEA